MKWGSLRNIDHHHLLFQPKTIQLLWKDLIVHLKPKRNWSRKLFIPSIFMKKTKVLNSPKHTSILTKIKKQIYQSTFFTHHFILENVYCFMSRIWNSPRANVDFTKYRLVRYFCEISFPRTFHVNTISCMHREQKFAEVESFHYSRKLHKFFFYSFLNL